MSSLVIFLNSHSADGERLQTSHFCREPEEQESLLG